MLPTNENPLLLRSLLNASDSLVVAWMSFIFFILPSIGLWLTNCQRYLSRDPNSFFISRTSCAALIAARIFNLFLITPGSCINLLKSFSSYFATLFTSKLSKALLYVLRRFRMVAHDNPACAPSRMRNSNNVLSSCTGIPHSLSW